MVRGELFIVVWLYVTSCARYDALVDADFQISNDKPDLHSGIEGGVTVEPMTDMFVNFRKTYIWMTIDQFCYLQGAAPCEA
jgi:hypothetical protein